jgi:NADH dehydrogenase
MELADRRPNVVIVGGGFGGIHAARALARAPVRVTLVDRCNHHLFQPLLYQVATAALSPGDIAAPIRSLLRWQDSQVLLADATAVDVQRQRLILKDGEIPYDYLILATGARDHYFGHDDWATHAFGLKTMQDALAIRQRILLAYERAEREPDPELRREWMTFVLIGAGPTGVEMAGALAEIARQVLVHDFRRINPAESRILLIEGAPRVLPSYPENLSAKAQRALERLGVEIRTGIHVTRVDETGVWVKDEQIRAHTVLWSAGVRATSLAETLRVPLDRAGRLRVLPDLTVPGHPNVFAVGDVMSLEENGKPVPGVAPAAMQTGKHAATNVLRSLEGRSLKPFHYFDRGVFAVIGRGSAVGVVLNRFRFSGVLAWFSWLFIHILFLIGFRNRLAVLFNWAYSYLFFKRGARLIYSPVSEGSAPETEPASSSVGPSRNVASR